jgi:hypothetical protein
MSVTATSHASNIWSRATSMSSSPAAQSLVPMKPNEAGSAKPKFNIAGAAATSAPFQPLSSDLQSALIQLQAQKTAKAG